MFDKNKFSLTSTNLTQKNSIQTTTILIFSVIPTLWGLDRSEFRQLYFYKYTCK